MSPLRRGDNRAARSLAAQDRFYYARNKPLIDRALANVLQRADLTKARAAYRKGDVDAAVAAILPRESIAQFRDDITMPSVRVILSSMRRTLQSDVPEVLRVPSGMLPPAQYTIEALQTIESTRIAPLLKGTEQAVRDVFVIGQLEGENPVTVARWARDAIGLTPFDAKLVQTFEEQLTMDPMRALSRTLRDGRFDSTVRAWATGAKTPTRAEIADHVAAYERGLRKWRMETFTRSTTLDALRFGQRAAWGDAATANGIGTDELSKTWITTLDGRERPAHHDANGITVPFDEPFPVDGGVMVPGESAYNCRCAQSVRLVVVRSRLRRRPVVLPAEDIAA